jgi:hypothetical protein
VRRAPAPLVGLVLAAASALIWVEHPSLRRALLACVLTVTIGVVMMRDPRVGIVVLLAALPFLGMLRRLLIVDAGWTSKDPLLLVTPAVMGLLMLRLFVTERRSMLTEPLEWLCALLGVISILEVLNPHGGGIEVGLGGLLFFIVPLMWFFAGRQLGDQRLVETIMYVTIAIALLDAAYGTIQTEFGLPSWDRLWVDAVGPGLLSVSDSAGSALRPLSSLSSPQEYMALLGIGIVFSIALARRHRWLLLTVPALGAALFIASGRSQFALVVFAIVIMCALLIARGRAIWIAIPAAAAVTAGAFVLGSSLLSHAAASSGNPLIAHEASGLANPLSGSNSTLGTHLTAFEKGVEDGFTHPLGLGTGVSTAAADTLGNGGDRTQVVYAGSVESIRGTDTDISNVFESFGFIGGFAYLMILALIAVRLLRRYARVRDALTLAIIGLAVVMTLQWLRGGLYAVSALTWFLFGWASRPEPEPAGSPVSRFSGRGLWPVLRSRASPVGRVADEDHDQPEDQPD